MTNKLRSVIEDRFKHLKKITDQSEVREGHRMWGEEDIKIMIMNHTYKFLDAIIEDMEEELLSLQYKLNTHRHDSKEYAFMYACKTNQELNVNKLKQAREELSTSLTQ